MDTEREEYLAILKATYDFTPQSDDEIALQEDQLLFLLQRVDDEYVFPVVKPQLHLTHQTRTS
jgi:actin cytoskeleton-regulatory complex protein SLA1